MRLRPVHWFALAALLLGGGTVAWVLSSPRAPAPPPLDVDPVERTRPAEPSGLEATPAQAPMGGTYGGIVVDEQGRPIAGAEVRLVRFNTGEDLDFAALSSDPADFDPTKIPTLGDFHVSGEKTRTGDDGRFRIQATGEKDRVQMVVAWKHLYAPAFVATGKPAEEVRVVLRPGGHLKGKVVDPSDRPVAGAVVEIYLQQPAGVAPVPAEGSAGDPFKRKSRPLARAPLLGDFLGRVIGPEVYGFEARKTEALTTTTNRDGEFFFGPVDDEVAVWVVVSHPDYKWTEHHRLPDGRPYRPVLEPGKVLERTYKLEHGNAIEGRVVSDTDERVGVEGVTIRLDHIVGYTMHPWYKMRSRVAVTREDGSFRMSGLEAGPYTAMLYHPSFGSQGVHGIPENAKNLKWKVTSRGALRGLVKGLASRPTGGRVEVFLEALASKGTGSRTPGRQFAVLSKEDVFELHQVDPGTYRAHVRAGTFASRPETLTIGAHMVTYQVFEAGGGAELLVRVVDREGRAVDPATVTLLRVEPDGRETPLGTFTSREGKVEERGLLPGSYRLEAWAAGFLAQKGETFALERDKRATPPPIVLRKPAWLRVVSITDDQDRPPKDATLELREGLGAFRLLFQRSGQDLPVAPGPVTVRGRTPEGLLFEETLDAREGEVLQVRVVLRPK